MLFDITNFNFILFQMDLLKELYRQLMASAEYQPKLDPDLPIHEQAENLPFNIKFEGMLFFSDLI